MEFYLKAIILTYFIGLKREKLSLLVKLMNLLFLLDIKSIFQSMMIEKKEILKEK